jgi:two-component system, chemotaxis family, chemotaxis protein CheY
VPDYQVCSLINKLKTETVMSKTILIVDDSESIREVVSFTLENEGYKVLVGVDGKDAQKFLDGTDIDLVITDLHMPELDGIGLIKEIRKREKYQRVPILFLTTESQAAKKMEAKEAGATGWIIKPFVPAKLLEAINKVLR